MSGYRDRDVARQEVAKGQCTRQNESAVNLRSPKSQEYGAPFHLGQRDLYSRAVVVGRPGLARQFQLKGIGSLGPLNRGF